MSHLARGPVRGTGIDGKANAVGRRCAGGWFCVGLTEATA